MLRHLMRSLCKNSGGVTVVAGAIGVLAGIEHFLAARPAPEPAKRNVQTGSASKAAPILRSCCFKIRQTRSEVGYVYWVLQGFGKHKCYVLHDTWQEAMDEVLARMAAARQQVAPALI